MGGGPNNIGLFQSFLSFFFLLYSVLFFLTITKLGEKREKKSSVADGHPCGAGEWVRRARQRERESRIRDPGVDTCGPRAISELYGVVWKGNDKVEIFLFLFFPLFCSYRERKRKNTNWAGNSIHLVTIINKSGHLSGNRARLNSYNV